MNYMFPNSPQQTRPNKILNLRLFANIYHLSTHMYVSTISTLIKKIFEM